MSPGSPPVFLVGCARSGTTLLRLMLNAHPDLAMPRESHFVYETALGRVRGTWPARLDDPRDRRRYEAWLHGHRFLAWWRLPPATLDAATSRGEGATYLDYFTGIFDAFRELEGKPRWGDKTPVHVEYLLLLDRLFPGARFVHLVRDGRAVAHSFLRIENFGPRRLPVAGHYWAWRVLAGLVAGGILGPERYREVRYEELVTAPEPILRDLLSWLDLRWDPAVLRHFETEAAVTHFHGTPWHGRLHEPVAPELVDAWRQRYPPRAVARVERQAGALLAHLGYALEDPARGAGAAAIAELLTPDSLADLDRRATPWPGGERARRLRWPPSRALAFADFARRDHRSWALRGLRAQRTLAALMG